MEKKMLSFAGYDWMVLAMDESKTLLMTKNVVERGRPYNEERRDTTWAQCTLRAYLNGEFFDRFTLAEKERVMETAVKNDSNPWFGTDGGNDTKDRVFLLSIEEVVRLLGDSGQLCNGNPNSKLFINDPYKKGRIARLGGAKSSWWLRSPGLCSSVAANVFPGGAIHVSGHFVDNRYTGIRPALYLANQR